MKRQWKLELSINSIVDGTVIAKLPAKYFDSRQASEGTTLEVSNSLPKTQFVTGSLSHPTYGIFYLDPTMWGTILNSRKWSF